MIRVTTKNKQFPVTYSGKQIGEKSVNAISVMFKNLNKAEKQVATKMIEKYLQQFKT